MDYILAFSAGLLSFLSPCVLPLIPVFLSYIVGSSLTELRTSQAKINVLIKTIFFVLGFSIVFIVLGVTVSSISKLFAHHIQLIQQVGGILIIIFGLHMTGIFKLKLLYKEKRFLPQDSSGKSLGALLLGMAFAVGWTPCIGPILSTILIYAGSMETINKGVMLLVFYSIGFAVPFLLAAILVEHLLKLLKKLTKYIPIISIISGIIMIVMGILVFTNKLEMFSQYGSLFNL